MSATTYSPWLTVPRSLSAPRGRILCVPHAGGAPSAYIPWLRELPADIELCIASLPGRERRLREPLVSSPTSIASALVDALSERALAPLVTFGHSFGSILAFEAVREMRRRAMKMPVRMVVSSSPPPARVPLERVAIGRDDDELLAYLGERLGGLPQEVLDEPELVALVLPPLRGDLEMHDRYAMSPEPPLDVPIEAVCGDQDKALDPSMLDEWAACTTKSHVSRVWPGGHFYLRDHVAALVALLMGSFDATIAPRDP